MTSRGRSSSKAPEEESHEDLELIETPAHQTISENDSEDDIYPDTDASLLRKHHREDEDGESEAGRLNRPGLIARLVAFMSLTPLLGGKLSPINPAKYGTLTNQASESSTNVLQSEELADIEDDVRKRDKRKGNSTTIRSAASFSSFGSRRRRDDSGSRSRTRLRRASLRSASPMLIAKPGHPAGLGGHVGSGLSMASSEDEEEAISIGKDDDLDPPDNSPYPQVRASVAATDDTSLSINTPRMWILSLLCAFFGSATNLFFSLRYPSVAITPVIALVVVHPLGRLWDKFLKRNDDPAESFEHGVLVPRAKSQDAIVELSRKTRLRLWLAQGDWNQKEHACVYVSSNVSFGFAFATDVIVEQSKFYHQDPSIIYQLLLTISTQILGYAFAALTRRYLVRPPSMIWPSTLMSTAMFTTMHSNENKVANGWILSRWKFFLTVWSGAFAWYFLPGLLMPALSYFSVVTWFAPKNVVIANLVSFIMTPLPPPTDELSSVLLLAWVFSP